MLPVCPGSCPCFQGFEGEVRKEWSRDPWPTLHDRQTIPCFWGWIRVADMLRIVQTFHLSPGVYFSLLLFVFVCFSLILFSVDPSCCASLCLRFVVFAYKKRTSVPPPIFQFRHSLRACRVRFRPHIRTRPITGRTQLSMMPDGGVMRLRAFGQRAPAPHL